MPYPAGGAPYPPYAQQGGVYAPSLGFSAGSQMYMPQPYGPPPIASNPYGGYPAGGYPAQVPGGPAYGQPSSCPAPVGHGAPHSAPHYDQSHSYPQCAPPTHNTPTTPKVGFF